MKASRSRTGWDSTKARAVALPMPLEQSLIKAVAVRCFSPPVILVLLSVARWEARLALGLY